MRVALFLVIGAAISLLQSWLSIAVFDSHGGSGWTKHLSSKRVGFFRENLGAGYVNIDGLDPLWYVATRRTVAGEVFWVQYKYDWPYAEGSERKSIDPSTLPKWSTLADLREIPPMYSTGFGRTIEQSGGWPFRAWYGRYTESATLPRPQAVTCFPESSTVGGGSWDRMVLFPYGPVFPGVIFNAVIYGVGSWFFVRVTVHATRRVRRYHRVLNRRCANCNYDVRTLDTCPECGEPRPAARRTRPSGSA